MSVFSRTMRKAISDYRYLLRRHLHQVERMVKLQKLNLRDSRIYQNNVSLFEIGHAIVEDIEKNMGVRHQTYYSYSGIHRFCEYLKAFLKQYYVENNQVFHRGQKASRALVESIQLSELPKHLLNEKVAKKLLNCNKSIVSFGSDEQCDLQFQILSKQKEANPGFYTHVISHLENLLNDESEAA